MKKKIIRHDIKAINSELQDLHPVLQRVYAARKIEQRAHLNQNLDALLPYQSLLNIELAATIIADAIMQQQAILIVGDFDADGATSTAVAIRSLKSFGATKVKFLVPNRFAFGYGLTPELVAVAKELEPALIITVDNGIANHTGVSAAKALGAKVVITDHHLAPAVLPAADAIVNPNQAHDLFPSKNLAGVGVIFYVMLAVRRCLERASWFAKINIPLPNMAKLLDIVALGTVADLVPLDHNNRILVHQGLQRIRSGQCVPGIVALLEIAHRDFKRCQASDLGFAVAARLNAAGRMDDMSIGIECLLTDDGIEARRFVNLLNQLNDERRVVERDMQVEALNKVKPLSGQLPRGVCLFDETWHPGVIGILASRIKEQFNRPVIVFAPANDEELKGSARSIAGFHIRDALALIDTEMPGMIRKFGGHAMAAGLTIAKHTIDEFAKIFDVTVSHLLTEAQLEHVVMSDGELSEIDFNLPLAQILRDAGPWGQLFPEPVFDGRFKIIEQKIVGDKHLKLRLMKEKQVLDAIAFFVDLNDWPNHRCEHIHIAYRLDINEYKGRQSVQLLVDYLEALS